MRETAAVFLRPKLLYCQFTPVYSLQSFNLPKMRNVVRYEEKIHGQGYNHRIPQLESPPSCDAKGSR